MIFAFFGKNNAKNMHYYAVPLGSTQGYPYLTPAGVFFNFPILFSWIRVLIIKVLPIELKIKFEFLSISSCDGKR